MFFSFFLCENTIKNPENRFVNDIVLSLVQDCWVEASSQGYSISLQLSSSTQFMSMKIIKIFASATEMKCAVETLKFLTVSFLLTYL